MSELLSRTTVGSVCASPAITSPYAAHDQPRAWRGSLPGEGTVSATSLVGANFRPGSLLSGILRECTTLPDESVGGSITTTPVGQADMHDIVQGILYLHRNITGSADAGTPKQSGGESTPSRLETEHAYVSRALRRLLTPDAMRCLDGEGRYPDQRPIPEVANTLGLTIIDFVRSLENRLYLQAAWQRMVGEEVDAETAKEEAQVIKLRQGTVDGLLPLLSACGFERIPVMISDEFSGDHMYCEETWTTPTETGGDLPRVAEVRMSGFRRCKPYGEHKPGERVKVAHVAVSVYRNPNAPVSLRVSGADA